MTRIILMLVLLIGVAGCASAPDPAPTAPPVPTEGTVPTEAPTSAPPTESADEDTVALDTALVPLPAFSATFTAPPAASNLDMSASSLSETLGLLDAAYLSGEANTIAALDALVPDGTDPNEVLFAWAMMRNNFYDAGALDAAEALIEAAPDDIRGYIAASDAYLTYPTYEPTTSEAMIQLAANIDGEHPDVLWRLSRTAGWETQAELFGSAEADGAGGYRFVQYAAFHLYGSQEYARAIPYLEALLRTRNDGLATYEARTALMGALMQTEQADIALTLAALVTDEEPFAVRFADSAFVAYRAGEFEQARTWAEQAQAIDPALHDATWMLALLAWEMDGDAEAALSALASLEDVEFYPSYLHPEFGHSLYIDQARILQAEGDLAAAIALYDKQINIDENATLYIERAGLHRELGNTSAAADDLNRALGYITDSAEREAVLTQLTALESE